MKIKAMVLLTLLTSSSYAEFPVIHSEVIGVMQCAPAYKGIPGTEHYDVLGCRTNEGIFSIRQYFEKFRRSPNYEIVKVEYNTSQYLFHIYYSENWR